MQLFAIVLMEPILSLFIHGQTMNILYWLNMDKDTISSNMIYF